MGRTGLGQLQSLPYRQDQLVLVVPRGHALDGQGPVPFTDTLAFDHVGLHANSSIYLSMHQAAQQAGRAIRLRMRVSGLDTMCRMIDKGLGVGVMPQRAFELMRGLGELTCVTLADEWAVRRIELLARDFSTLPVTARLLVDHLRSPAE